MSESHCQLVNCSAGTIAITITGTASTAETISALEERPSRVVGSACSSCSACSCFGRAQRRAVAGALNRGDQIVGVDADRER